MAWKVWDREERLVVAADRWLARLHKDSSPATVRKFQRWRDRHPSHRAALEQAEANWRELGGISPLAAIAARRADERAQPPYGRRFALAAAAAALILTVGGGIVLHREVRQPTNSSREVVADAVPRLVHLRDGSTVFLDAGSAIATHFAGPFRAILLERGRARFSVAHDPAHPFVVTAGDRTVTARGTVFDVVKGADRVSVTMLEGVVEVKRIASVAPTPVLRLTRGEQAIVSGAAQQVSPTPSTPDDWTRALQALDNLSLAEILTRANRSGGKPIILADPGLGPVPVQGQLATSDTRALAIQLAAALDLDLREEPGGYVLTPQH